MLLLQNMLGKSRKSLAAAKTVQKLWRQQYKDAMSEAQPYPWMTPKPVKAVKVEPSDASGAASAGVCFSVRSCEYLRTVGCVSVYM